MIININKQKIIIASILLLFFLYACFRVTFLFYFGIILLAVTLLWNPEDFLTLFVIAVPFTDMFKAWGGNTSYLSYIVLAYWIIYFLKKQRISFSGKGIFLVHAISVVITCILCKDVSLAAALVRNIMMFFFIADFFEEIETSQKHELMLKLIKCFIFGSVLSVFLGFAYFAITGNNIFGGVFSGVRSDRNYFSSILSCAILLTLSVLTIKKSKLPYIIALAFLFLGGVLSGSRTFLASMVWCVVLMMLLLLTAKYHSRALGVLVIVGIVFVFSYKYISPYIQFVWDRFSDDTAINGAGRFEAWAYYLQYTFASLERALFGGGLSIPIYSGTTVQHNTFIQAVSEIGIVGTITLVGCYVQIFRKIVSRGRKFSLYAYIPLLTALTCYFFINALYSDFLNVIMVLCFGMVELFNNRQDEEFSDPMLHNANYNHWR